MLRSVTVGRRLGALPNPMDALPPSSPSWFLMEKVMDFASERGAAEAYSPWLLTDLMQNTISLAHSVLPAEMGWLGAIAVSAIGIRALLFPLTIQSIREGRLKTTLLPQYTEMLRELGEMKTPSASNTKDSERLQTLQKKYIAFTSKYGNVALKGTLASAIQIPMIMTGIVACNGIAMNPAVFPSVALESPLWLTSAALPDPFYILPAMNAGLVAFNMNYFGSIDATATPRTASGGAGSMGADADQSARLKDLITSRMGSESAERTSQQIDALYKSKFMKIGKKMFPLFIFGITMKFPAVTLVYTIANIGGAMGQNYLVTNKRFQRMFDVPAQAKRSGDEIEELVKRADEIRTRIDSIATERKSKRRVLEESTRATFRRPAISPASERSMKDLLEKTRLSKLNP